MTEADYVVVGAGSAGCVLADRLTEDGRTRVVLLEAGPRDRNPLLRVPIMTGMLLRGRAYNWAMTGEPEPSANGRRLDQPRGKVLGGSSSINGMVYTRGFALDYDSWAQRGLPGWSYADVLPYFRREEHFEEGADDFHAQGGRVQVSRPAPDNPLFDAWKEAGAQVGLKACRDFNGADPEGVGFFHFTIGGGRRVGSAQAYLRRAERRQNLEVLTGATASHLIFDGARCAGVALADGREIRARREVIVSAGAFHSPWLLLRSGLGPPEELARQGIAVRAALSGVGRELQDHQMARVLMECTQPVTLFRLRRIDRAAAALLQALVFGTGPASRFPLLAGGFLKTRPGLDWPDIQCHFLPGLTTASLRWNPFAPQGPLDRHGFFANAYVLRPFSRGRVGLSGPSAQDPPRIEGGMFADRRDLETLRDAMKLLRRIFAQPAFDAFRGAEIAPGAAAQSDEEIEAYLRETALTAYHPVGTCRMGMDAAAGDVVDARLRVFGVPGLRVVDASVMPALTSGNTHAPTMMIAEKASDMIREDAAA
ncbi:GMC family oxidoreductase [Falsiroseomonas sp. HW251]|uniref:GMC family oxidoreductase n=1 Tax=Falsiroseomonas sp. HW251 TaxID=3390998 RepID=UPI003D31C2E6